jgi:Flp pilus assembly protein TadG
MKTNHASRPIRQARRRSGIASAEFALLVPFLVMIVMGMLELGRAMMVKTILSDAAHKACRTGIKRDKGNSDITSEAINVMNDNGFGSSKFNPNSLGTITITVTDPNGNKLDDSLDAPSESIVSVQVSIPVSSTTWVTPFYLGSGATLESETVVMMKQ